jgi:hypothetical protein
MVWCDDNRKKHRLNGPAIIEYYRNLGDYIKTKQWYYNGKVHRYNLNTLDDKPAYICYYDGINIEYEIWYQHDIKHRFNDPAEIHYYPNGQIKEMTWYRFDKIHSYNDTPAYIAYDENGRIKCEKWYHYGKLHRYKLNNLNKLDNLNNKPTVINYYNNNKIELSWYKFDKKLYSLVI